MQCVGCVWRYSGDTLESLSDRYTANRVEASVFLTTCLLYLKRKLQIFVSVVSDPPIMITKRMFEYPGAV